MLLNPREILVADEPDGVRIYTSRHASIVMDSAPGDSAVTSLWQNNLVGLRAERMVNWKRAKVSSVKYISGAVYA